MIARPLGLTLLVAVLSFALLSVASPAQAAKGVRAEKARIDENADTHSWKLKLTIDHGSIPDRDIVPMIFSFKQTAIYERSFTDESPDKAVLRTVSVSNQVPNNSEQDVSFADSGTGKRFAVTKFPITVRRKNDFEAGEYELTIKLASGGTIGTVRLQFAGDNKPIDRRSLVFAGKVSGGKKANESNQAPSDDGKKSGPLAAEEQGPDLSNIPDAPSGEQGADDHAPASVPPKQGGCGCHTIGSAVRPRFAPFVALALAFAVTLRRRYFCSR